MWKRYPLHVLFVHLRLSKIDFFTAFRACFSLPRCVLCFCFRSNAGRIDNKKLKEIYNVLSSLRLSFLLKTCLLCTMCQNRSHWVKRIRESGGCLRVLRLVVSELVTSILRNPAAFDLSWKASSTKLCKLAFLITLLISTTNWPNLTLGANFWSRIERNEKFNIFLRK